MNKIMTSLVLLFSMTGHAFEEIGPSIYFVTGGPSGFMTLLCANVDCSQVFVQANDTPQQFRIAISADDLKDSKKIKKSFSEIKKSARLESSKEEVIDAINVLFDKEKKEKSINVGDDVYFDVLKVVEHMSKDGRDYIKFSRNYPDMDNPALNNLQDVCVIDSFTTSEVIGSKQSSKVAITAQCAEVDKVDNEDAWETVVEVEEVAAADSEKRIAQIKKDLEHRGFKVTTQ